MKEFDLNMRYAGVDGKIREEVKGVMDYLLENCHSLDVMELVLDSVAGIVRELKDHSSTETDS